MHYQFKKGHSLKYGYSYWLKEKQNYLCKLGTPVDCTLDTWVDKDLSPYPWITGRVKNPSPLPEITGWIKNPSPLPGISEWIKNNQSFTWDIWVDKKPSHLLGTFEWIKNQSPLLEISGWLKNPSPLPGISE